MKIKMLLTVIGMGIALTACAGGAKTEEPATAEQGSITEKAVETQPETKSQAEESRPEETEINTQPETEMASEVETASDKETETEKASDKETETEKASDKETASGETSAAQEAGGAETAEVEVPQAKGSFTQADIAVSVRGVTVAPGEIMEGYVSALGDPDAYEASPSCVEVGDDKIYTYGGVIIYSCRFNGTDRINLIEIKGAETMVGGIHIGDTMDAVIAAYGESYTMEGNEMIYEINDRVMGFSITDGKVSFMELFAR